VGNDRDRQTGTVLNVRSYLTPRNLLIALVVLVLVIVGRLIWVSRQSDSATNTPTANPTVSAPTTPSSPIASGSALESSYRSHATQYLKGLNTWNYKTNPVTWATSLSTQQDPRALASNLPEGLTPRTLSECAQAKCSNTAKVTWAGPVPADDGLWSGEFYVDTAVVYNGKTTVLHKTWRITAAADDTRVIRALDVSNEGGQLTDGGKLQVH
jgi:hypothetical protein